MCRVSLGERERGIVLINISQAGQILKMKCLHMPPPPPPLSAGQFDYCRKPLFHPISASPLLSHTPICIFSLGSLPYLSIHPVTPVIHLFFPLFPQCFLFLPSLWQRRASSKCRSSHELSTCFGHLYWYEKVQSFLFFLIPSHNNPR